MPDTTTDTGVESQPTNNSDMIDELTAFLDAEDQPPKEAADSTARNEDQSTAEGDDAPVEETEAEGTDEPERSEADGVEGDAPADDDRWMPDTLESLAEALGTDLEDVSSTMKIKTKIDGEEGEATLAEVVKSYQLESALTKRSQSLAEERKEFESQRDQELQTLQQKAQEAENMTSVAEQMLLAEYQSVDWKDLQDNDPTEFLMQKEALQQKYAQIQTVKGQMEEQRQQQVSQYQEQMQEQMAAFKKEQDAQLVAAIPEWKDDAVKAEGMKSVKDYMKRLGATEQEVETVADHRVYLMAHKAMLFDQMQTKAAPKAKQMKSKPKFVPPGTRKSKQEASQKSRQQSFAKAKKLQTDDAWAEALAQRLSL